MAQAATKCCLIKHLLWHVMDMGCIQAIAEEVLTSCCW
jgi:hypothetical protein